MTNSAQDLYEKFYTQEHPELGTEPVSTEPYISEEFFQREQEKVFSDAWMMICSETEIPNAGDYIVKSIPLIPGTIIIWRGRDKVVRAFKNACPHRGNQLIYQEGRGNKKVLSCPFHGWSFNADGGLRGLPEEDRFFDLDKSEYGLVPVNVDTWRSLVFLNPSQTPKQGLEEYLGTLGEQVKDYPYQDMRLIAEWRVTDMGANWKIISDAFQEGYHVQVVHATVAPSLFTGGRSCRMSSFRLHGQHRTSVIPKNPNFEPSATEALAFQLAGASLAQDAGGPESEEGYWTGLNPENDPNWGFDVNCIFPSSMCHTSIGWYFTYEYWPVAVNKTHWVAKMFVVQPQSWSQRLGLEFSMIQLREAILEDVTTLEATQRGLESRAFDTIILSDQELSIRHQHKMVVDAVNGE